MPLMGSFYVGTSGLQTSQNALNTTSHNLSNIYTTGYTRQQVVQANRTYNTVGRAAVSAQQVGLGVSYAKVRQVRDYFLDKSYRLEAGRSSYYDTSYSVAREVETLFGEMEGVEFQTSLTDFWTSIQELQKDPSNATNQGLVVSTAASFIERAQAVYNGLASYQDILNTQIKDTVDTINEIGASIKELNDRILRVETGGQEEANDLRDARNQLIDELSTYGTVTAEEDIFGAVTIQFEGTDFVTRTYINEMGLYQDEETGFYTPIWPQNGEHATVFDLSREICSDYNTDVGGLKALVLTRGWDRGTYRDIPAEPNEADYPVKADYEAAMTKYNNDVIDYNASVNKSLIQNTMAEFDKLINGIVTQINDILNPVSADGTSTSGIYLFLRDNVDEQKTTGLATAEDPTNEMTLWTTSNLKVNPLLLQQYAYLGAKTYDGGQTYTTGFMTIDGEENHDMADALAQLFKDDFATLNPNISTPSTYVGFYNNMVSEISITGNVYKNISDSQSDTVGTIDSARQQVVGVSDNEELSNLIMYQNAYNAASRYINTVNTMLGTLIESMI